MQEAAEIDIDMHVCKPAACCMLAYAKPPRGRIAGFVRKAKRNYGMRNYGRNYA